MLGQKQLFLFIMLLNISFCFIQKPLLNRIKIDNEIRLLEGSDITDTDEPSNEQTDRTDRTDGTDGSTTSPYSQNSTTLDNQKSSSGLSTGAICAIAIPTIAALLGVAAAAAFCKGGVPPQPTFTPPSLPPPNFIDTSLDKFNVVPELPPQQPIPQPQPIIQPPPEIKPVEIPKAIRPNYPINKLEPPAVNRAFQPLYTIQQPIQQPMQMTPVQQFQMVPVPQVEMVPYQEVVPVQQVVPIQQGVVDSLPHITPVEEVGQVTGQVGQVIQGAQIPGNSSNMGFSVSNLI